MSGLRFGLWGGRGDRRGLAAQTTEIVRHVPFDRVLGVDMGDLSPFRPEWSDYPASQLDVVRLADLDEAKATAWLSGLDAVFGCETFYVPWFVALCQRRGVRTVLQVNPEFVGHVYEWGVPTLAVNPTSWRHETLPPGSAVLPLGVDRSRLPFVRRDRLRTLLHVVGHGAAYDRNGTRLVLDALRFVRRPLRVIIRTQRPLGVPRGLAASPYVELEVDHGDAADYWRLYDEGDALVLPRRYGGQSLPMVEALSRGMPVLASDAEPQRSTLPADMLVAARSYRSFASSAGPIPLFDADPVLLAGRIHEWYDDDGRFGRLSDAADEIAGRLAWPALAPRYLAVLADGS